jgi:hypothetical protein
MIELKNKTRLRNLAAQGPQGSEAGHNANEELQARENQIKKEVPQPSSRNAAVGA